MTEAQKPATPSPEEASTQKFGSYIDIPMRVTVELGRRRMKVRDILRLQKDSVVELPRSAGENIDIYINGKLVAYGEVLELEGKAGIRVTDFHAQP
jgi:flagellar motor switch protein FliN/FliY